LAKIDEQALLAAIDSFEEKRQREEQCEAWFYIGIKRLLNGDRAGAADAFRKSVATEEKTHNEFDFAKAELKELGK
jgi:lipoprotein NlpI